MVPQLSWYLALSAVLFTIGVVGVLVKRNVIAMFMCIELMLNAVNLTFVAFSSFFRDLSGQMFVFIVMTVAAAEAAVERAKAAMKEDQTPEQVAAIQASLQKALAQLHVKRRRHG